MSCVGRFVSREGSMKKLAACQSGGPAALTSARGVLGQEVTCGCSREAACNGQSTCQSSRQSQPVGCASQLEHVCRLTTVALASRDAA